MTADAMTDHPNHTALAPVLLGDSLDEGFQVLDIAQIVTYEHNPRLLRNAKMPQIKEAIRASNGLTEPLSVTRRPGEDVYVVQQGGNTRMLALRELYGETENPAFRSVPVMVQPYTSEIALAALHDRENTCRGDLSFFEEAWSKYRQWELYLRDGLGDPKASSFVRYLNATFGASLTTHRFSRMRFAVETLYQHMPTCLVQGAMSQRAVRDLITTQAKLRQVWVDHHLGTQGEFEDVFFSLLSRQDKNLAQSFLSPDADPASFPDRRIAIDWKLFAEDFAYEMTMSDVADIDFQEAEAWIAGAFQSGGKLGDPDCSSPAPTVGQASRETARRERQVLQPTLLERRAAAFRLAKRVAEGTVVADCLSPTPDEGVGYTLRPMPSDRAVTDCCWTTWSILAISCGLQQSSMTPAITMLAPKRLLAWAKLIQTIASLSSRSTEGPSLPDDFNNPQNQMSSEEVAC